MLAIHTVLLTRAAITSAIGYGVFDVATLIHFGKDIIGGSGEMPCSLTASSVALVVMIGLLLLLLLLPFLLLLLPLLLRYDATLFVFWSCCSRSRDIFSAHVVNGIIGGILL